MSYHEARQGAADGSADRGIGRHLLEEHETGRQREVPQERNRGAEEGQGRVGERIGRANTSTREKQYQEASAIAIGSESERTQQRLRIPVQGDLRNFMDGDGGVDRAANY